MEFDSPEQEVEKEFPGLYGKPEAVDMMSDPVDYDEEDKKKKKDKKDSKKDKGYATLADENSQDEEDESHQAKKKLKGLLSGKKKDKDKDKEHKDSKKEKKQLEKEKKSLESERKSSDREVPFSSVRIPFSAERHRDINAHRSSVPTALFASTPKSKDKSGDGSPVAVVEKERSSSSAFNAFINAPTPLFLQKKKKKKEEKEVKEKEHKKDKSKSRDKKEDKEKDKEKHPSGVAKVKLKLMRSKNSLEDPHEKEKGELHVSVSHQFPEDPEALAKEIRKHETLLEQTHGQLKSCKKVTKKQEEQLWELQRTLTALKRKLRSINALSAAPGLSHSSLPGPSSSSSVSVSESPSSKGTSQSPGNNTIPLPVASPTADKNMSVKQGCEITEMEGLSKNKSLSSSPLGDDTNGKDKETSPAKEQDCEVPLKNTPVTSAEVEQEESPPAPVIIAPPKKTARRSLDFSGIVVENKKPVMSNNESRIQPCCSAGESWVEEEKVDASFDSSFVEPLHHQPSQPSVSPLQTNTAEHEKMEVHVMVHQESKEEDEEDEVDMVQRVVDDDDSSVARSEEDEDEAQPSISSRTEENINIVLDDANAMIGSMHEELEAAAFVFGQKFSKRGGAAQGQVFKEMTTMSKSEPTFETNDSSDVELIRDEDEEDELPESFMEELIPELLCLPEFETPEYLSFENEQLATFNKAIQEEIIKEETELQAVMEELDNIRVAQNNDKVKSTEDESLEDDCDMEQLIEIWKTAKSENDALQANVARLRHMVALHRLDEFRLETRLRFLEDKVQPIISPITTTTPLHSETFN